jgi:hypothetical protein
MLDILFPLAPRFSIGVDSPQTPRYNCLAWALRRDDLPIWPDPEEETSWPVGWVRNDSVDSIIALLEHVGFVESPNGKGMLEAAYEKIAIYAEGDTPLHVARQDSDGIWKSKLGILADIWHKTPFVIESKDYGRVVKIMRRSLAAAANALPELHPAPPLIFIP